MKILYLVRHARAGDQSDGTDFNRTLTERGNADARNMAQVLAKKGITVDLLMASPAARTRATAAAIAAGLNYPYSDVVTDPRMYDAADKDLLTILREISGNPESLMVVGHNPGLTDFANGLAGTMITSMPTSSVVALKLRIKVWNELRWSCGEQLFFESPL